MDFLHRWHSSHPTVQTQSILCSLHRTVQLPTHLGTRRSEGGWQRGAETFTSTDKQVIRVGGWTRSQPPYDGQRWDTTSIASMVDTESLHPKPHHFHVCQTRHHHQPTPGEGNRQQGKPESGSACSQEVYGVGTRDIHNISPFASKSTAQP